jgi:hypothetical protein
MGWHFRGCLNEEKGETPALSLSFADTAINGELRGPQRFGRRARRRSGNSLLRGSVPFSLPRGDPCFDAARR